MEPTTSTTPTIRLRISHTHTQRAGWQHETTVEIFAALPGDPESIAALGSELTWWQQRVDEIGRTESVRRNALDKEPPIA